MTELARPSIGVEDIIRQLVQNTLKRVLADEANFKLAELSMERNIDDHSNDDKRLFDTTIGTSRDYLAKLLFWSVLPSSDCHIHKLIMSKSCHKYQRITCCIH